MSKFRSLFVLVILLCAFAPGAWAQYDGNISGTVKDESGAVIPGANVAIANEANNVSRTVVTDDTGYYLATNVPIGTYTVTVELPGFKRTRVTGVKLDIRQNRVIDLTLSVGGAENEITVESASVAQIELRSGEVSNLIAAEQVSELPLNNRSFVQLSLLVPGASVVQSANVGLTGLFAGVDISFSGSPSNANMWLVDGTNNVDVGSGRTILTYPSVDSIAEFKISRNLYGADSAASSGAQINVVTKSGTNEFHGTIYEFHRNGVLNAADFDLNRSGADKQGLVYNNFGYTLGGPIVKDKAFFFWSQEWRREGRGVPRGALVPTLAERAGDFSGSNSRYGDPNDPLTGMPFPGNQIPADRLSPAGQAFLNLYPAPTLSVDDPRFTGGNNWIQAPVTPINTRQEQIRADYVINNVHSVLGRYTKDTWVNNSPSFIEGGLWGDDPFPPVDSAWDQPGFSLTTEWTATFGPNLVNQVNFSFSGNEIRIARGAGEDINQAIVDAIPEVFPGPGDEGHPVFWGAIAGESLWHQAPWQNNQDLLVWKDDLSIVKGSHSMKLGALVSRNAKNEDVSNNSQAYSQEYWTDGGGTSLSWAGVDGGVTSTGNGIADLLLRGTLWGGGNEHDRNARATTRWRDYEFFFADTWRVKPRFTLNYGVRWSYLPNPFSDRDEIANFTLDLYDPAEGATPTNGLIFPGNTRGLDVDSRALVKNHAFDIAPRLGFAWDPTGAGKWSIRGGLGVFYNREAITDVLRLHTNPPFVTSVTWPNGRPFDFLPPENNFTGGAGVAANAKDISGKTPGSYQWNLTIERELWKDTKIELAYVANRGHNIPTQLDLNTVPTQFRRAYTLQSVVDGDGAGADSAYRPLAPLVGGAALLQTSRSADSWYHSFQLYLVRRFANRLSYQVSYTWSKLLSNSFGLGELSQSDISDPFNLDLDKALASTDRTHLFNANLIYKTPALQSMGGLARGLLGDWETSIIFTANSGVPQLITCCTNFTGTRQNRPDLIGNPEGAQTVDNYFNTGAFAPPGAGLIGTAPRGVYRGPGINNWDISLVKNFPGLPWFTKEDASIQFRAEFFNAFNHTQFLSVDNGFSPGDITFDPVSGNLTGFNQTNNNFGRVDDFRQPREIQFALKIIW